MECNGWAILINRYVHNSVSTFLKNESPIWIEVIKISAYLQHVCSKIHWRLCSLKLDYNQPSYFVPLMVFNSLVSLFPDKSLTLVDFISRSAISPPLFIDLLFEWKLCVKIRISHTTYEYIYYTIQLIGKSAKSFKWRNVLR